VAAEAVRLVRDHIGSVASLKLVLVVERLPKTRSGNILRQIMRKTADGEHYKIPGTVMLGEISEGLKAAGFI
jgi:propionyl-CoA synthetase